MRACPEESVDRVREPATAALQFVEADKITSRNIYQEHRNETKIQAEPSDMKLQEAHSIPTTMHKRIQIPSPTRVPPSQMPKSNQDKQHSRHHTLRNYPLLPLPQQHQHPRTWLVNSRPVVGRYHPRPRIHNSRRTANGRSSCPRPIVGIY